MLIEVWDPLSKMLGVFWIRRFSVNWHTVLKNYYNMFKNYTKKGMSTETITVLSEK
jgi:predicted GNAT superfamily acetyltransferase